MRLTAVEPGDQSRRGDDPVGVLAQLGDLGPVEVPVKPDAEPAAAADVGRPEEPPPRDTLLLMKFAIAIPQFYADGEFDPGAFRAYFARAEELGFDSAWTQEKVLGAGPQLSPIETMTYAAACTERMRLGCVVFVSTLHNPVHLAKSLSTLDQLSRGRIEVGVGTGGRGRPFAAFGVDPHRYVARFTEGVKLMQALWTEPLVTFHGEFWQLENAAMEPKPFQKPYPPLWFGGASEPALRRAVRLGGHGFFGAGSSPTDNFAEQVRGSAGPANPPCGGLCAWAATASSARDPPSRTNSPSRSASSGPRSRRRAGPKDRPGTSPSPSACTSRSTRTPGEREPG